jgi:hypothetical protein
VRCAIDDTNLGLSASVWGKDLEAVERIARQIQAGSECFYHYDVFEWPLMNYFVSCVHERARACYTFLCECTYTTRLTVLYLHLVSLGVWWT